MSIIKETTKKKLSKIEVDNLAKLYTSYQDVIVELGQLELDLANLQKRKESVLVRNDKLISDEQLLVKELNSKYGEGVIDPKDWTFVPNITE
jgi:hypothetical protein